VNSRLAGDAVGATKMDRPEWSSVNPANGEIYFTLTNNSNRSAPPAPLPDSANPRVLQRRQGTPLRSARQPQRPHLAHVKEGQQRRDAATSFTWDVYLFGAESECRQAARSTCPPDR
jgi:secreted PhoX family phosphatase